MGRKQMRWPLDRHLRPHGDDFLLSTITWSSYYPTAHQIRQGGGPSSGISDPFNSLTNYGRLWGLLNCLPLSANEIRLWNQRDGYWFSSFEFRSEQVQCYVSITAINIFFKIKLIRSGTISSPSHVNASPRQYCKSIWNCLFVTFIKLIEIQNY